ncbi:Hypothetical predicted protein [Octopus vulgaris]|uniref:Fucolectin-like n=1 Tax=Octopus vulgaris TaxID=6645 RepID=A0AA36F7I9_OCTVU|nr:Hypothetical predicted protein [Octopus vulgaris]
MLRVFFDYFMTDKENILGNFEIQAAGNNIAQGKPVQQSSVAYKHGAQLAIDGKTNGIEPCSRTNYMKDPWWIVDLGVAHKIDLVTVYLDGSWKYCKSTRTKMIQSFTSCTVRSQLECAIFCHNRNFCSTFSIRPSNLTGGKICFDVRMFS